MLTKEASIKMKSPLKKQINNETKKLLTKEASIKTKIHRKEKNERIKE
jgi:hypothetical protein